MAPKRKRNGSDTKPPTSPAATTVARATRSSAVKATRSATSRGAVSLRSPVENPEPRKSKKAKTAAAADVSKVIVIEYCKNSGKKLETKAKEIKNGLEKDLVDEGIKVVMRAKKGYFVIRENSGDVFVDMKKPFDAIDEMDTEKVVADIVAKVM